LPHQQLLPEYLDYEESAHKQSATGFDSMALYPEGRICSGSGSSVMMWAQMTAKQT
jgi:hypothetical protein